MAIPLAAISTTELLDIKATPASASPGKAAG